MRPKSGGDSVLDGSLANVSRGTLEPQDLPPSANFQPNPENVPRGTLLRDFLPQV